MALAAVQKQLAQKKNGKEMSQKVLVSVHEWLHSSSAVLSRATSLLLGWWDAAWCDMSSYNSFCLFFFPGPDSLKMITGK